MRCPFCGNSDTTVKDSRTTDDQSSIRRRRFCTECGSRFTTYERIQLRDLVVVKKNGVREPFNREKLQASLQTALHKRSMDPEKVERLITSITRRLETSVESEITTTHIGEMVLQSLANLDPVAYVRFASVYRDFSNLQDFIDLIQRISMGAKNIASQDGIE
ncbi:MAG TPA: transcriptional regulator NrdR [Alphaproteobacteria bacterium]|nr:transcriptional regulator NrdR [Alphaproteobacteria bacterium]